MALLVLMQVGPVDRDRFRSAAEWMDAQDAPGRVSSRIYAAEGDPKTVLVAQEWESHDAFHSVSERLGPEFNARAGTEGLDWKTMTWVS